MGPQASAGRMELMAVSGALSESYDMHLQADGSLQHDSVYPAVFTCEGKWASLHMFLFKNGRLLRDFRLQFGPESVGQGQVTCMPMDGVEVDCDIQEEGSCEEDEEFEGDGGPLVWRRYVTVDRLRVALPEE